MEYSAEDILTFWFVEATREQWFKKDVAFDQLIAERYNDLVDFTAREIDANGAGPWEGEPRGDLASIIVLDQFPRNLFRNSARAFSHDSAALALAKRAMLRGSDMALSEDLRAFIYMPFMHAEDLEAQETSVAVFETNFVERANLPWAIEHRDIIKRFGRFPHRNVLLGRDSTAEEIAYLDDGGFAG